MRSDEVLEEAKRQGFDAAVPIKARELVFRPEFRVFCEENRCGQYGVNYACPPYCGTVEEMRLRTEKYQQAVVLRTDWHVGNAMDGAETKPLKMQHNAKTIRLVEYLRREEEANLLAIAAGPCSLCRECLMTTGRPCPKPEQRFSCLSAYCIDAQALAAACHMQLSWDMDRVSFFSIVLFNEKDGGLS